MNYFVTAIGTDSGKTLVSAILIKALNADYWKPIQSGYPTDREKILKWLGEKEMRCFPEKYKFSMAASPHVAAQREQATIAIGDIETPKTDKHLIIEGAGGVLVPLNDSELMLDLIEKLADEVILVSNHYLGSINHTLLTVESLKRRKIKVRGIIFNGKDLPDTERIILKFSGYQKLMQIPQEKQIDKKLIERYAKALRKIW